MTKLLIDFLPIALFFAAFKLWDIYVATGVAIVATIIQIAWLRYSRGKVEPMQWLSLGIIVVFGGATILAHDESFIKWKPTVLYWLMGATLLVGWVAFRRNFLKTLLGAQLELPEPAWRTLLWSWVGFFTFMGALNLWVAFNFDTDTWVNFKLFGGLGLLVLFALAQGLYMSRFMKEVEAPDAGKP